MPTVTLTPLAEAHRELFLEEELANYASEQEREAGWPPEESLARARTELGPILERRLSEAPERGHRLWSALDRTGEPVGWLWVTPAEAGDDRAAFLYQITVAEQYRRRGFGRAMLRALEDLLARDGLEELRLNVMVANEPARRLYAAAGYELVDQVDRRCRMRKRVVRPAE